jgi:uncharacterized membrane protein YfcA
MTPLDAALIALAGLGAGAINTIVGSGTLITFPTLILLGYPPLLANVSNNLGLVPGAVSGTIGYRRELIGQGWRVRWLAPASLAGGTLGAVALLVLPESAFDTIVPVLIILSLIGVVVQPWLRDRLQGRVDGASGTRPSTVLITGVFLAGIYGGYFGAAQGVLLIALLGILAADELQRLNATKNVLAMLVNAVAAVIFVVAAEIDWAVAGLIAVGSTIGGQVGATLGRRMPPTVLRGVIVVVGSVAVWRLLTAD